MIKLLIALSSTVLAVTSYAHHDISKDIDLEIYSELEGAIELVEWINPHVIVHVNVKANNGLNQLWLIQADSPNALLRRGINRNSLEFMSNIRFRVYPSSANFCGTTCMGYGYEFTDPRGRTRVLHQSLYDIVNQLK